MKTTTHLPCSLRSSWSPKTSPRICRSSHEACRTDRRINVACSRLAGGGSCWCSPACSSGYPSYPGSACCRSQKSLQSQACWRPRETQMNCSLNWTWWSLSSTWSLGSSPARSPVRWRFGWYRSPVTTDFQQTSFTPWVTAKLGISNRWLPSASGSNNYNPRIRIDLRWISSCVTSGTKYQQREEDSIAGHQFLLSMSYYFVCTKSVMTYEIKPDFYNNSSIV